MPAYPYSFGLDPSVYDFGSQAPTQGYEDPSDSFMERARRALEARRMVEQQIPEEPPPEAVSIPRVQNQAENPTFFQKHQGGAKAVDIAAATLALLSNLRTMKKNKAAGYYGSKTPLIQIGSLPSITRLAGAKTAAQNKNEQDIQEQNSRIAEAESRINTNAMSRYATRRAAVLGQMVPSMTKAALREPHVDKPTALEQRLQEFERFADENRLPPDQRQAGKAHILGAGDMKSPQERAQDVMNASMALFKAKSEYALQHPKANADQDRNFEAVRKYISNLVYNDFFSPEEASKMGMDLYRTLSTMSRDTAKSRPGLTQGAPNTSTTGLPAGVPASPAGGSYQAPATPQMPTGQYMLNGDISGLQPGLQDRIKLYIGMVNRHPERRAQLREDMLRTTGIDPDLYLAPGQ